MSKVDELNAVVASFNEEADKFYNKGNKAAGTRARGHLQTLKNLAQDIRKDIQAKKNAG